MKPGIQKLQDQFDLHAKLLMRALDLYDKAGPVEEQQTALRQAARHAAVITALHLLIEGDP